MFLTLEFINTLCPEHGRTSCNDENLANGYGGWNHKYDEDTGKKVIRYPRCKRCYLLNHIGEDMDKLEFKVSVSLDYRGGE